MARSMKFQIYEEEELYYPSSESAPLFLHRQKSVFLVTRLICMFKVMYKQVLKRSYFIAYLFKKKYI